jgi:hypothetical protein
MDQTGVIADSYTDQNRLLPGCTTYMGVSHNAAPRPVTALVYVLPPLYQYINRSSLAIEQQVESLVSPTI